ncbi:AAA-domain-containing protein [Anaeromyces robustus]|uniref:AAA-domain-containing protein n=1 Tax=Anaeromyces robustus TaxID=1754192 RepID=A0A1Y1XGD0_9FUNG|nr:AAA-domain-containing protein [Anaeromyces robustus]|eukprot:ORX84434.1 AAA-domain-containing protein [Anaeromyces robustus]
MNDNIKKEETKNKYSTRLRNSLPHINYAEDYADLNYDDFESSDDNRIYSRLNTSLSRNRKRRKIYTEKENPVYIKINRNTNTYKSMLRNRTNNDDQDNNNFHEIEDDEIDNDDNDTINENEIENVDEIRHDNVITNNIEIDNKEEENQEEINNKDSNNVIKSTNNENEYTEPNHYNTRYNTRSHFKKINVKLSSVETTTGDNENIENDSEDFMDDKKRNRNEMNHIHIMEEKNKMQISKNDISTKVIEDDLENSFDIHRRGRPRRRKILFDDQDEENTNNHYNLRNRSNSNTSKRKAYDEDFEDQNTHENEKTEDNFNTRYETRYATRYQTRYATRYAKIREENEEEVPPRKIYLRKHSLELKKLIDNKEEMLESRKVGNYNLRRSDQSINYSLPNLMENNHKDMEKNSRNQRHRMYMNRSSSSYSYRKKRSYSYRDKSDSEDERKNLFIGKASRRIGLGGNGLKGNDDDGNRSIVPLNIKELLLAEQKVLQQMHLSSNPNDNEILKNMLTKDGQNIADTDQVDVKPIDFNMVGGLDEHIQSLKEMVILPLLYPEVYSKFSITPPRGVLFHGPPGTGKTLLARALASSCSTENQKVAFFMRKGADCLTKWVGESERQLKLLFEEAKVWQPSIIFFDEIDGLAPVRSSKQDQIHSSIVTTLLSLMDGLDKRGQVVVIGATNRIDSIDPALRRPGRFDREFYFPLPNFEARKKIIEINTKKWKPSLEPKVIDQLANITKGYCGADVKALCTEAAIHAMKKTYPQIYDSSDKLLINTDDIVVEISDFLNALKTIKPSTFRSSTGNSREIPKDLMPLFQTNYINIIDILDNIIPIITKERKNDWQQNDNNDCKSLEEIEYQEIGDSLDQFDSRLLSWNSLTSLELKSYQMYHLRLLICGKKGMGQTNYIGPAIINKLENWGFFIKSFDLNTLLKESYQTMESTIISSFQELSRHSPVAIYIPNIDLWWDSVSDLIKNVFLMNLEDFESKYPIFFLATCNKEAKDIPTILKLFNLIPNINLYNIGLKRVYEVVRPNKNEIKEFFKNIINEIKKEPPVNYIPVKSKITNNIIGLEPKRNNTDQNKIKKILPKAPPPPPREFTKDELERIHEHDEYVLAELRRELRTMTKELRKDKELKVFCYPVDLSEAEDYLECIEHPMDFSKIDEKIDNREYNTPKEWYDDIELIVNNAMTYNQNYDPNNIIRKAKILKDSVKVMMHFLNPELVWECNQVIRHRKLEEIQNKKNKNEKNDNTHNHSNNNYNNHNHHNSHKHEDTIIEGNKYQLHAGAPGIRQSRRLLGQKPDLDIVSFEYLTNLKKNKNHHIHNNDNTPSNPEKELIKVNENNDEPKIIDNKTIVIESNNNESKFYNKKYETIIIDSPKTSSINENTKNNNMELDNVIDLCDNDINVITNVITCSPEAQSQSINDNTLVADNTFHEKKLIEEKMAEPVFELDTKKLNELEDYIISISQHLTIEMIQFLSSELTHLISMKRSEWNRNSIIEDGMMIVKQFDNQNKRF